MAEDGDMTDEPNVTVSNRGFQHMDPVPGHYGGRVRVYESSGDTPCIWLCAAELDDLNGPQDGPEHEATVLLKLADARVLRDQLTWLIDNHFPGDEDEEPEAE